MNKYKTLKQEKNLDIIYNYKELLKKSWTYDKMTKEEKETFDKIFSLSNRQLVDNLSGKENQKKMTLNIIYSAFLAGIGYNGFSWREEEKKPF